MVRGVGREEKDSRREGEALRGDERREKGGDTEEVGGGQGGTEGRGGLMGGWVDGEVGGIGVGE